MTDKEAIQFLQTPIECADKGDERDFREAMDMGIKALKRVSIDDILDIAQKRMREDSKKDNPRKSKDWNEGFDVGMAFALVKILEVKSDLEEALGLYEISD